MSLTLTGIGLLCVCTALHCPVGNPLPCCLNYREYCEFVTHVLCANVSIQHI